MDRQIDCPICTSTNTFAVPETMWLRWCRDCGADWDIRQVEEIENE
jgi:hypothetical protein